MNKAHIKIDYCQEWAKSGTCRYGDRCKYSFSHRRPYGPPPLRDIEDFDDPTASSIASSSWAGSTTGVEAVVNDGQQGQEDDNNWSLYRKIRKLYLKRPPGWNPQVELDSLLV